MSIGTFLETVEAAKQSALDQHRAELDEKAINCRDSIIREIKTISPAFADHMGDLLDSAHPGWVNHGPIVKHNPLYGIPGVVIEGVILAPYWESKTKKFFVAKYNGYDVVEYADFFKVSYDQFDLRLAEILKDLWMVINE